MNESKETIKKATAFAYGYSLVKLRSRPDEDRRIRVENLRDDMKYFGIMLPGGTVLAPYHLDMAAGKRKAEDEEEALEED